MQKVACGTGRDRGTTRGPRNRAPVIWGQEGPWAKTQALGVAEAARPWSSSWRPPGLPRPPSSDHWGSVSSAPSHIRGCPRAGRTSAGPREWPWLDAPSRGSRVLLLRSALAASLDCVVGVGDVGLFGGQHWRERRGSQESEASFSTRPRAHTARRGTRSRPQSRVVRLRQPVTNPLPGPPQLLLHRHTSAWLGFLRGAPPLHLLL